MESWGKRSGIHPKSGNGQSGSVREHESEYSSPWAAIESEAGKIGCASETLRKWMRCEERDRGERAGMTTSERERLKALERENRVLGTATRSDTQLQPVGTSWWRQRHPRYERIRSAIQTFDHDWPTGALTQRRELEKLLKQAEREAKWFRYHAAWECFHAATRLALADMDRALIEPRALALAEEAKDKLDGWRLRAAKRLLPLAGGDAADELRAASLEVERAAEAEVRFTSRTLRERPRPPAMSDDELRLGCWAVKWLLDGRAANLYLKQQVVTQRAQALAVVLTALVASALALFLFPGGLPTDNPLAAQMAVFGGMGATFSALMYLPGATRGKIPDVILSATFTALRPVIGVAAALLIYAAEDSVISIVPDDSRSGFLVLAFAAGFSDALVTRVVGHVNTKV